MSSRSKKLAGGDVKYALHDPAIALTSLFRPISKNDPRPAGLKVKAEFHGLKLMFTCYEALDVRDQSVLLAVIAVAGIEHKYLHSGVEGDIGKDLWANLEPKDTALGGRAVVVQMTHNYLLGVLGMTDAGNNFDRLKERLYRLSQVGCRVQSKGHDWAMRLLSYHVLPNKEVAIALNERFALSISAKQFVKVSLNERQQLSFDIAQILHAWLCAVTRPGSKGVYMGVDTLQDKVWGERTSNGNTLRSRRSRILAAVDEITALGWKTERRGQNARLQLKFQRPKIVDG